MDKNKSIEFKNHAQHYTTMDHSSLPIDDRLLLIENNLKECIQSLRQVTNEVYKLRDKVDFLLKKSIKNNEFETERVYVHKQFKDLEKKIQLLDRQIQSHRRS